MVQAVNSNAPSVENLGSSAEPQCHHNPVVKHGGALFQQGKIPLFKQEGTLRYEPLA